MSALTAPAMIDALKAQLEAREGIAGDPEVAVYTAPVPAGTPHPRKAIVLVDVRDLVEPASIGPVSQVTHREQYTVEGYCSGSSPLTGEAGAKAARDACLEAVEHVHQQLRTDMTVNSTVVWARLASVDWDQGVDQDRGRVCLATFTVAVEARI